MSGVIILALRLLMAIALYGFLAWAIWTLWRDLKRQNELLLARQAPSLTLTFRESGQVFSFNRPVIRIGRDLTCDCHLDDQTVSTQHARLSFHHNQWWIEDLGSTNGTFLNQNPVTIPVVVTRDDQLQVGQVKMDIFIGEPL
jgi:pSer/pThr/pTyr-binding forkhead associated (FHA) protein